MIFHPQNAFKKDGSYILPKNVIATANPCLNKDIIKELNQGLHIGSAEKEKFYRYLSETTGNRFQYVHLTSSGSEASEWAVRMALKKTGICPGSARRGIWSLSGLCTLSI